MQTKGLVDGLKEKNLEEKRSKQLLELELNVSWAGQSVVMSLLCMPFCLSVTPWAIVRVTCVAL